MHAIDSGHFVIFILHSTTGACSLLSPVDRLYVVAIYSRDNPATPHHPRLFYFFSVHLVPL